MSSTQDKNLLETARDVRIWLPEIPERPLLDTYRLVGVTLGSGGFGTVEVGCKKHLNQKVAIKRIHPQSQFSETDQRRFVREVRLLAPLQAPNIIRVDDWGRDEHGLYIVMELVEGPNLFDLVRQKGRLSADQVLNIARQICQALQFAHQQGIVHRDLKPANLLVDPHGIVKLADFGLAREASEDRERLTSSRGAGLYTFAYASPEQLRGDQTLDGRSDLFSLGATLYHLAMGHADTSRVFDLDELPESCGILQPLLSALLRPNRDKRPADVAAVLSIVEQAESGMVPLRGPTAASTGSASIQSTDPKSIIIARDSSRTAGKCWTCDTGNPESRKFCADCGTALRDPCLKCDEPIGVWERFCPECGFDQQQRRQELHQQSEAAAERIRQHLQEQRYDLAESELRGQQAALTTRRLQQLQPALPELQTGCQEVRSRVESANAQALTAAESKDYSGALRILESVPTVFWPEPAERWRQVVEQIRRLLEQLNQPPLKYTWHQLTGWHAELDTLQPGRLPLEEFSLRWLSVRDKTATELCGTERWDDMVALLETVPTSKQTPSMEQLGRELRKLIQRQTDEAAAFAGRGEFSAAVEAIQRLPAAVRPPIINEYAEQAKLLTQLQQQLTKACDELRPDTAVQLLAKLEVLQPGRWQNHPPLTQCVDRLLAQALTLLNQKDFGGVSELLGRVPVILQSDAFQKTREKQTRLEEMLRSRGPLIAPFDSGTARNAQAALATLLKQPEEWTNTIGMKLRLIPAGTFLMGSPEGKGRTEERPQHKVTITRAFRMAIHTVTQGQWQQVMNTTPWKGRMYILEGSDVPATNVSWDDAVAFCERLSSQEGRRYRLPTEAEWEWCCRAGTTTEYSFGNYSTQIYQYAWLDGAISSGPEKYAHPVGRNQANPFGLFDMHGNVCEWCQDWKDNGYYATSPVEDPRGPSSGSSRVLRGGGWLHVSSHLRSAYRDFDASGDRYSSIGCRVLCELE